MSLYHLTMDTFHLGAGDDSLLNDQAVSTSQAQESAGEGREFYDKLLVRF